MSHSARLFIWSILIVILHFLPFFSKTSFGSDSLKVGLIFEIKVDSEADSLSKQLVQELFKSSQLKVVNCDTNEAITFEPLTIDSTKLMALKEQQFQGLILCQISRTDSVNKLIFQTLAFENLKQKQFEAIALDQKNSSDKLVAVVREIEIFFLPNQRSKNALRIIFAPMIHSKTDSSQISFQRSTFDSLKKLSILPRFSRIEVEFLAIDSIKQKNWTDSTLQKIGKSHHAHLILTGKINKDKKQNVRYYPRLVILKKNNVQNPVSTDDSVLSGKTCQISPLDFPAISLKNLSQVTDFIKGYFLIQEKKYSEAVEQFEVLQSFPAHFYLGVSYLYRGAVIEHDPSLTRADCDSAIFYCKKCLSQTQSLWDSVYTNNNLGVAFQLNGQVDSAVVYFSKANSRWTEIPNNEDFIQISHNLGNSYLLKGQWNKALDIFQSTVQAMEQSNDSLNRAVTYESLGHIYQLIYQRNKAISCYQKALELRKKMPDEAAIANSFNFLANAYQGNKDFQLAKDYFKKSLTLSLKIHHEPQLASAYDNMGLVFQDTGELDSALFYFQKSHETFDMLDDKDGTVQTMLHQASVYQQQKVSDKAISLYEKSLEMIGDNNSRSLRAQIYDRLGDIYNNQNNLIPALDYYQQATELYERMGNQEILSLILYNMGLIKLKQNDYAGGYQLLKRAVTIDENQGYNNLRGEKIFLHQLEGILKKD